ncbi:MAG TPA: response regulator [Anaerolineales bacterium]|nr:response regulator [Anaerolineales bacterium]
MKNIWIVDDDEEMTLAIQLMLKLLHCNVTSFLRARPAAQTLLSGKQPDLMILDINMPEVSGLDLLEYVRRRQEWNDLPIIMLSTEAADVTVDKAMDLGADGYVSKPVTIEELEKVMNQAFQKHQKGLL